MTRRAGAPARVRRATLSNVLRLRHPNRSDAAKVNGKSNWLSSNENLCNGRYPRYGRDREDAVLLAQVARRGCHDRALGDHKRPARRQSRPDVVLADEVEG